MLVPLRWIFEQDIAPPGPIPTELIANAIIIPTMLYIGNDMAIEIIGLKDGLTGAYISDATVTVVIRDADGAAIAGQSWPVSLAYQPSSAGNYVGVIGDSASLIERIPYRIEITANDGGGRIGFWKFIRYAIYRTHVN